MPELLEVFASNKPILNSSKQYFKELYSDLLNRYVRGYGCLELRDKQGKTQSKSKLVFQESSTYLLTDNTRYIDIVASKHYGLWLNITVVSMFPFDGFNRYSEYKIPATKFLPSRIDLTRLKASGLLPFAVKISSKPNKEQKIID